MSLPLPSSAQLHETTRAWNILCDALQPWNTQTALATASGSVSASTAQAVPPSVSLPSESSLTPAYETLKAVRLDALWRSHVIHEILKPFIATHIVDPWWSALEPFQELQLHHFGRASRPGRSHPHVDAWVVHSWNTVVQRCHQSLQPLFERLRYLDDIIFAAGADRAPSLLQECRAQLHTQFAVSLSAGCPPLGSDPFPLRRSGLLQELLLKYYRINFRLFVQCARSDAESTLDDADVLDSNVGDDGGEAVSETVMDDSEQSTASVVAIASALPSLEAHPDAVARFAGTCSLLLQLGFLGKDGSNVAERKLVGSLSTLSDSYRSTAPWLDASYYLDFFFLLISQAIERTCRREWDSDRLTPLLRWMDSRVKSFLHIIVSGTEAKIDSNQRESDTSQEQQSFVQSYGRLHMYALETLGSLRIRGEMFDIVKYWPDSLPAVRNLATILATTKQHALLVSELSNAFRTRLQRPGTATHAILEQYVNAVACLRTIDPPGHHNLLGGLLTQSGIHTYLRARPDTVRCIVQSLWGQAHLKKNADDADMDDDAEDAADGAADPQQTEGEDVGGLDLSHELEVVPDATQFGDDSDVDEAEKAGVTNAGLTGPDAATAARIDFHPSDAWAPEPIEDESLGGVTSFDPAPARYLRSADVLSLLIDLCGHGERNEEVLLQEYKRFLSERFLHKRSRLTPGGADALYETATEVTHLELMKLRFGDAHPAIIDLDIMLKDITNSKRLQAQIQAPAPPPEQLVGINRLLPPNPSKLHLALLDRAEQLRRSEDVFEREQYESERHSGVLQRQIDLASNFRALIVSGEYWPNSDCLGPCDDEPVYNVPPILEGITSSYAHLFNTLKGPRVLEWALGSAAGGNAIEIEIEMRDGRTRRVECNPLHAAILEHFADTTNDKQTTPVRRSVTELLGLMGMSDEEPLVSATQFWVQQGVLRQLSSDTGMSDESVLMYEVVEDVSTLDDDTMRGDAAISNDGASSLADKQRANQDEQVRSYVLGALNNFARYLTHTRTMHAVRMDRQCPRVSSHTQPALLSASCHDVGIFMCLCILV